VILDMHAHFYGETLFRLLGARAEVPRVERVGDRRFMVTPTSRFALAGGFVSVTDRLGWMDAQRIDRQLITFPGALGPDVLPIAEARPLVRDVNDEIAATVRGHPDRFIGLAGLPLADLDSAVAELERAVRVAGLVGAIVPSNYFATLALAEGLRPLLTAADALGAHIMLHPGQRADESLAPKHYADLAMHRASTIDLHAGITHALLTLIHSGATQDYPRVTWQVVNLGGAFPFMVERMDHIVATRDPGAPRPSAMLDGIVVDSASLGPRALELAVKVFGPGRVMLGTDYPIFVSDLSMAALADADIGDDERARVGSGTALALLARHAKTE
jgi:predicted TIM-barrel fold metal-dependent hydrolase